MLYEYRQIDYCPLNTTSLPNKRTVLESETAVIFEIKPISSCPTASNDTVLVFSCMVGGKHIYTFIFIICALKYYICRCPAIDTFCISVDVIDFLQRSSRFKIYRLHRSVQFGYIANI